MILTELWRILEFVSTAVWRFLPVFVLTVALSVLVRRLKLDQAIRRALTAREGMAVPLATAVGAFSPFCSCTVVPVINGLLRSGIPLAPVMAFWIASPTMDPEIFVLSVGLLGWPLALTRLGATLLLSLGAGYLTMTLVRVGLMGTNVLRGSETASSADCGTACAPAGMTTQGMVVSTAATVIPVSMIGAVGTDATCCAAAVPAALPVRSGLLDNLRDIEWRSVGTEMLRELLDLGRWLLLAFVLEALISFYVPQQAIAGLLGRGSAFAVPLAALLGVPLYLGNAGALPIAAGLLEQGMQPGAAIAFLIAGPVTTLPAMAAVAGIVRRRVFALYVAVGLFGAMLLGLLANLIL